MRTLQSLSDDERSWVSDHADFECAHEAHLRRHQDNESKVREETTNLDKSDDGFERSTAVDHAHTGQVGCTVVSALSFDATEGALTSDNDGRDEEVAREDLKQLKLDEHKAIYAFSQSIPLLCHRFDQQSDAATRQPKYGSEAH